MKNIHIFRLTWSHAVGVYWAQMRSTHPDDAEAWLRVFRQDEPNAVFIAASKPPKIQPGDEKRALHPAVL